MTTETQNESSNTDQKRNGSGKTIKMMGRFHQDFKTNRISIHRKTLGIRLLMVNWS